MVSLPLYCFHFARVLATTLGSILPSCSESQQELIGSWVRDLGIHSILVKPCCGLVSYVFHFVETVSCKLLEFVL